MKPLILILILFFIFCNDSILSQKIVIANKQWEGDQFDFPFGPIIPFNSKFRTTYQVIDGINYRELLYKVDGGWFEGVRQYYREEDNKVYKLYEGEERAILDFTLNVGDTMQVRNDTGEKFDFVPYRTNDTIIQNIKRRKLELRAYPVQGNSNDFEKHVWIEGVGDIGFFFGNGIAYKNQRASLVYCVKESSSYIYGAAMLCPNFILFPNTTNTKEKDLVPNYFYDINSNVIHIKNVKINSLEVYSIGGIKLKSHIVNSSNNAIDLSTIDLPLCVVVVFDGETYQSKVLKL